MQAEIFNKPKILVVDDEETNLRTLRRILRKDYNVLTANSGMEGIEVLEQNKDVALILSDQRMPNMSGSQFLGEAIKLSPDALRFLITGYSDMDAVVDAINTGHVYRYITKPWNPDQLLIDVKRGVEYYVTAKENERLSKFNAKLVDELKETLINTVLSISDTLEAKDSYTHGHSTRVTYIAYMIGEQLGLDKHSLQLLQFAGHLHDIGKVGVPERILNKPGKLTDEEYAEISKHPVRGGKILERLRNIQDVISCVVHHHERFDGKGHPDGLKGGEIPMGARILAVADTYDAMTSNRPYRNKMPHEVAVAEIQRCSGSQFDPNIVDAFLSTNVGKTGDIPQVDLEELYSKLSEVKLAMDKLAVEN